jgi:integrase
MAKNKNHHLCNRGGVWYFRMKGQRFSLHTTSVTTARELRDQHYRDMLAHGHIPRQETKEVLLFGELAVKCFELKKGKLKKSTLKDYRNNMNNYILPRFGNIPVDQIGYLDIESFISELKLKNKRIINMLVPIRNVFRLALKAEIIEKNPMDLLDPIQPEKPEITPFSFEEVERIVENADDHYRNFLTVLFYTGLRFSEAAALKWERVDFDLGVIKVREALVLGEEDRPKTPGSIRDVKMFPMVVDALVDQQKATFGNSPYVFLNKYGRPLRPCPVRKHAWKPALEKAGLQYRTMRNTRHSYITMMLDSGEHVGWVARQVGHTSPKMIFERYYSYIKGYQGEEGQRFMARVHETTTKQSKKVVPFLAQVKKGKGRSLSNCLEFKKKIG